MRQPGGVNTADTERCEVCTASGRRDFVLDALRAGAIALAALGFAPGHAGAMPLRFVSALSASGTEKSYAVPAADGVQVDKENEVILSRVGRQVYAFALACPHQNTVLRWEGDDHHFKCPKHKSTYRPDGSFIEGRATRSMDRYAIRLAGPNVFVDIDSIIQEDLDKARWLQAFVAVP